MVFSLRIVNADFYTADPMPGLDPVYSDFRSSKIVKVPVIRIFGSTPNGQKCCLHIHGVFPYICVPYGGDEPRDAYLKQFATSVDFALHVSQGKASSTSRHVHKIEIISARSFYGYHDEEQEFMKVYFYNPFVVTRVVELLQSGAVMNKTFQPYESHIPYIQQMFIDYNLYGMNLLNASSVMFRTPIQLKQDDPALYEDSSHSPVTPILSPSSITTGSPCEQFWTEENVPRNCRHASAVERISLCELEVDVKAEHVMNQFEIGTSIGTNPGLLTIWQDEQQRRQDENDTSDLGPPISQERGKIPLLEAERRYKERLEQIIVDRNLMIQSQAEDHVPSSISPPPIEREPSSFDINENTPIVDHSILEEVTRSSQRAFSQETGNATDVEMIEILASLAESQSQSRCQDPIVFTSDDDEEDENERQEQEDSIVMSQQVWDDTDPAEMIDNADISGESNEHENTDGSGPQPLRMSQFDFQGLDETWEVSLLSEEPIPQVDGTNDDTTGTPPPVRTSQKKRLSKRISYPTRNASTQKTRDISSPDDITSSVVVKTGSKKRNVTRRLGMSSVRVTRRSQKTDLNEDDSKPLNDQPELGESEHLGKTVARAKSSNPVASSKPIAQSKTNLPKVTRRKNTSPQFSLHLSESSSSAEESAISLNHLSKQSEIDYAGSKIFAPEITHVTDLEIPHVKVSKTEDGSPRKMSLSLRSKPRRPSYLMNAQRDSSLVHMSDHIPRARTRDTNEVNKASSFECTRIRSLAQKSPSASEKEALPTDEVKRLKICLEENDLPQKLDEQHQTQQKEQRQHLKNYHYQQEQKRQQQQAESRQKGENCYKDIKRRVFSEFKCSGLKARTKKDTAELLGKDSIETTDLLNKTPLKTMKMHRKKQQRYTTSSKTPKSDSEKLELNSIEDISPKKVSRKLDIRSSKGKTNNFNKSEYKVNETKSHESDSPEISLHDKLEVNIEKQESVTPNQNQNVHTQMRPQMKSFKIFLTDVASIDSKRYLYNAALERWKRQNNEQQKLKRIFSASHKSPLKRIVNFSSPQRRRNSSPRKSPQGKRYGVLDVTIHISSPPKASSEDQATPMSNRTASSPLKRARSSTFTKVRSQSQQSTDSYVSSSSNRSSSCTKTVFPSPPLTDTNSASKCQLSTAFAVSPDKIQFKYTNSPDSKRLSTPNKIANTKRKILTEIDRPSFPRQRQANEIDRLFDTLGSCLSKEEAYSQTMHGESGVQNELSELGSGTEERNVNKYQDNADCVSAKQISIKEDGILTENLKRKRSDSNATCRKQPKLSLKLKQKTSSQVQKAPNDSEKYSNKKTAKESAEFDEGSPAVTDRSSDSPSILDKTIHRKSMSVEELSTPWKVQINSNFNNNDINSVCTDVAETKSQRNDVNEGINTDEPLTFDSDETCDSTEMIRAKGNEHGDETNGRRTSVEEIEKQDPVLCSSPDLFDSALFNMSYLSPERCDEERSSPPLPFTPCKENDIQRKEEEPQGVATKQVQGACDLNSISEKYPFKTFSPAFHSNLSANVYSEELNESSVNSSKLIVGLSQAPEKPARSLQTKKNAKFQNKSSASSAATVNRTCTTVSESKYVKQTSALTELRRYCRQLEKEKLALMGLSVESSENSVSSSSAVEIPAVINHSSQDDLCSTRYSEISPSCSPNSACPKKDSSIESTSPFRGNVLSMGEKACHANVADSTLGDNSFFLPKEINLASYVNGNSSPIDTSTSIRHGNSPVDGSQAKSLLPTTTEPSIEIDLHISNRSLIETSEENASLEQEKSQHNLVGSLSLTDDDDNNGMDHHSMISSDSDHSIQNENVDDEDIDRGNSSADKIDDGNEHSSPKHDLQEKELSGESTFLPHKDNSEFSVMNEPLTVIMPQREAPTATTLMDSLDEFGIPRCRYQEPFYSDPNDVPDSIMDVGGRLLKVQSNQVKTLQKFDTKSPFVGIQEVREIFYSSHENSFLHACQDNIGTSETFMVGIENNPELKVAFMGDKDLTITPCSIPPHPAVVLSWAQTKLTKKLQNALGDNKNAKLDRDENKTSLVSKEKLVEPVENRQTNLSKTESFHDKSKNDSLTGCGKASKAKCIPSSPNRNAPSSANSHDKEDRSNGASPDFPSNDLARITKVESKTETGSPPNREEITSPNTLFSPVDKSFDSQSKKEIYDSDNNKKQSLKKTSSVERKTSDEQQERKKDAQVFSFAFQSTPLPHKTKPKSGILSPSTATPATIVGLPRFPFLTPISASTQVSSNSEKQTVNMVKSPSGEDTEKVRNSDVAPRRQLILSQLKLLTPEIALRRNLSEAGSDIEGPSPVNTAGYKVPQLNVQDAKASHEVQHLTLLSIELHVRTRKDKKPDPEFDPICAVFYHIQTDSPCPTNKVTGIICVDKDSAKLMNGKEMSKGSTILGTSGTSIHNVTPAAKRPILERSGVAQYKVQYVEDEKDIFHAFLVLVRKCDPDILIGYELQMLSWGYLIQRALIFDLDLGKLLSRVTGSSSDCNVDAEKDQWGAAHLHELKIGGRIILNVWRLMRHEVALNIYSFENVAFHVLHERIPLFTFRSLSDWWDHKTELHRWRTVEHYVNRCHGNIRLLEQVDFIGRTSELARLFGILFYSVISRGSQFRVESMMLRISKPLKYLAISPSVQQRNSMNAPEVIPLVLEPESRFYTNPVLVLDFQSLYPSMIIAYNYCYSTCLGRISCLEELGEFKFGASTLAVPPILIKKLKDDIHISPNGVAFVKSNVRLGVLPKMLEDILNTRIMVKTSMKKWKHKKSVHRMLDARQLGLKLIANVTYGYTAAHFSGRMPCVEIGDSIVRKARETLEHAIHVVNTTSKWGARVVYGDTDSMFVLLDGVSKDEAFNIGRDIAATITALNPKPVKLKFEKVYLPCVLQTKKRYVGYMYETPDQKEPVFDAKGIETVRRDSCPAVAKVLEKSLRLLFETKDVSLIKRYVQRQFSKVMEARVSLQDLTFAKEYRGMASYKPGACVPALELTRQMLKEDRRSEPRVGERVPYVIVYGSPGLPLIKLVRRPQEVLQDPSLRINARYYITKQLIPPLNRAFSLIGVDVSSWFAEVPRTSRVKVQPFTSSDARKKTISHYFTTTNCPVCQQTTTSRLCDACTNDPQKVVVTLNAQIRQHERRHSHHAEICYQCCGSRDTRLCCVSLDCPVFHKLVKTSRDLEPSNHLRELIATSID